MACEYTQYMVYNMDFHDLNFVCTYPHGKFIMQAEHPPITLALNPSSKCQHINM